MEKSYGEKKAGGKMTSLVFHLLGRAPGGQSNMLHI